MAAHPDTCPKCGAKRHKGAVAKWQYFCGSGFGPQNGFYQGIRCECNVLAEANAKMGEIVCGLLLVGNHLATCNYIDTDVVRECDCGWETASAKAAAMMAKRAALVERE